MDTSKIIGQPEQVISAWAAYYDNNIRLESSSGGFFSVLAEEVLSVGGIVYGVTMDEDCYGASFIRVDSSSELKKLRGSKYLQAKMFDTLRNVENDLKKGIYVLFSGTGCQVNGLRSFLRKDYPNLLCVDVICHGVPSPLIWKKYVEYIEETQQGKIIDVNFRCKDEGWKCYGIKEKGNLFLLFNSKDTDPFMRFFLSDLSLRPSCYSCNAKSTKCSDFSIGDFWRIHEVDMNMDDDKGTSLILIRTNKADKVFQRIKNRLIIREVNYYDGVIRNPAEYRSVNRPDMRDSFFNDIHKLSIDELMKKYIIPPIYKQIGHKIKLIIKRMIGINANNKNNNQ